MEQHVARLNSIIQVILEEIEAGTILESAWRIREALNEQTWDREVAGIDLPR